MVSDSNAETKLLPPGCGFWFGWVIASTIGGLAGWAGGWRLSFSIPGVSSSVALGFIMGLMIGAFQWMLLRGQMHQAGWWVPASAVGWAIGFPAGVMVAQRFGLSEATFGLVAGGMTGAVVGLFQAGILIRQSKGGIWWVPVSTIAWAASLVYYRPGLTLLGAMYGILSGILTGVALVWLLYRPTA